MYAKASLYTHCFHEVHSFMNMYMHTIGKFRSTIPKIDPFIADFRLKDVTSTDCIMEVLYLNASMHSASNIVLLYALLYREASIQYYYRALYQISISVAHTQLLIKGYIRISVTYTVTVEVLNCTPKPLHVCRILHTVLPAFHKKVSVDYVDDSVKCGINCSLADIQLLIKGVLSSTCCVSSCILELLHINIYCFQHFI